MYLLIVPAGFEELISKEIPGSKTLGVHSRIFVDKLPKVLSPAVRDVYKIIRKGFKLRDLKREQFSNSFLLIKEVPRQSINPHKMRERLNADNPKAKKIFRLDIINGNTYLSEKVTIAVPGDYQTETFPFSLKPEFGYCMLKLIDPKPNDVVYDPLCGSGTIPIEAARTYNKSVEILASDINEKNIEGAEINAKNAKVRERIRFFVHDVREEIKEKVDIVITELPFQLGRESLEEIYKGLVGIKPRKFLLLVREKNKLSEYMNNADYILTKEMKVIKGGYRLKLLKFNKKILQ